MVQRSKKFEKHRQNRASLINRKTVHLQHDNARPHTAKITRDKINALGWRTAGEVPHPPYSPDLAPSDYHLFRSLQNFLDGKKYNSNDEIKNALLEYFGSKPTNFYEKGIKSLPDRWRKVLNVDGEYFVD